MATKFHQQQQCWLGLRRRLRIRGRRVRCLALPACAASLQSVSRGCHDRKRAFGVFRVGVAVTRKRHVDDSCTLQLTRLLYVG